MNPAALQTPGPLAPPRSGTRGQLLRRAAAAIAGGGAAALVTTGPGLAVAKPSSAQDVEVLNLLLLVEQVQEAFYAEALKRAGLDGDALAYATAVAPQEGEHVAVLRRRLGSDARPSPRVAFGAKTTDAAAFREAATRLEELAVAAYVGQGPYLTVEAVGEVARIASVEARHAAWIRTITGALPAPNSADPGRSAAAVERALRNEGFLA